MSRKTTAALIAALGINFALAGGALMLANLNKPVAYDPDASLADAYSDIQKVAGRSVDAGAGDLAVPLKAAQQGGNTRVTFTCRKQTPAGKEMHDGTWDRIAGAVLYRPEDQKLLAVEAVFDTRSLRTDTHALTQTVTTKEKWFDIDNHPTATFTCDTINPANAATTSYTHDLVGQFKLNGISKPLTIPAKLSFSGQSLTIDADFTILRSDYGVEKRESSIAGSVGGAVSEVDNKVEMSVRVTASPDPTVVVGELAHAVELQQAELKKLSALIDKLGSNQAGVYDEIRRLDSSLSEMRYAVPKEIDLSKLPQSYRESLTVDITNNQLSFDMLMVPAGEGGKAMGFYMSKHEVTWEMMYDWMYCADIESAAEAARLIAQGKRPSPIFGTLSRQFHVGMVPLPAMGMTRLTASAFCDWLSEKTGRRYRLPTYSEWQHALKVGGGVPEDLDAVAWHAGNAPKDEFSLAIKTTDVGTKRPNAIGIHDMLGSVSEWVVTDDGKHTVVGGAINNPPEEINESWRAVEDVEVWSASYPGLPKSRFWYVDYYYSGIRLVCEAPSVAANPPKDSEE